MAISPGNLMGFISLTLLSLQFVLSSRSKFLDKFISLDRLMKIHALNSKTLLVAVLLHPVLVLSPVLKFLTLPELLITLTFSQKMGTVAVTLLIVVVVTSIYASKLTKNYEQWQLIHKITYLVVALGFFHAYFAGTLSYGVTPFWYLYMFLLVLVVWGIATRQYGRFFRSQEFKITKIVPEADSTLTVYLKPKSGRIFDYQVGQFAFITFYADGLPVEEHHFTLTSLPGDKEISFTIKASGDFTSQLNQLNVGDKAMVDGGFGGLFRVDLSDKSLLLVAGGIGITPIMAKLRQLKKDFEQSSGNLSLPKKVVLVYSSKTEADIVFKDEITKMSRLEWLDVYHCLSKDSQIPDMIGEAHCLSGRFEKEMLKKFNLNPKETVSVVVGPPPMTDSVTEILRDWLVPRMMIRTENFSLK